MNVIKITENNKTTYLKRTFIGLIPQTSDLHTATVYSESGYAETIAKNLRKNNEGVAFEVVGY